MTDTLPALHRSAADDIVDCMSEALIFADPRGIIRLWNPGAEFLFGYSPEEAVGKSLDIIIPEHLRSAHWDGYHRAIAQGATTQARHTAITRALHRDGKQLYVDMSFAVVRNPAGDVTGSVAIASDATQRHLEERELRRRLNELAAKQQK